MELARWLVATSLLPRLRSRQHGPQHARLVPSFASEAHTRSGVTG